MLAGTYIYGMDRKGRVVMPAAFRKELGVPFVLTRAPGQALLALSAPQWSVLLDRYERSTLFRGYYLSAAVECAVDPNTGRFLVPHALREHAELRPMDEVAIAGIGRAVQVVKRARWDASVQSGEFPSLGQLDLDLEVPRPVETSPFRQRVGFPMGIPLVEARGRLDGRAVRALASTLLEALERRPAVLLLDLRYAGETDGAVPVLANVLQSRLQDMGAELWLVGVPNGAAGAVVRAFADFEAALWALSEAGFPMRGA